VNQNSFNTFNEYTSLFEQPRTRLEASVHGGTGSKWVTEQTAFGGNDRAAYFGYLGAEGENGARPGTPDKRYQGSFELSWAATANTNLIGSFSSSDKKRGYDEDESVTVGLSTGDPITMRHVSSARDTNDAFRDRVMEMGIGLRHSFSPRSVFEAAFQLNRLRYGQLTPDFVVDLSATSTPDLYRGSLDFNAPFVFYDVDLQSSHRRGQHTFVIGAGWYRTNRRYINTFNLRRDANGAQATGSFGDTLTDEGMSAWIRHEANLGRLHTILGLQAKSDDGNDILADTAMSFTRVDPLVGFAFRITNSTVVRGSAFSTLNSSFVGTSIAPTSVAGFVIERNEVPYAKRREANLSISRSGSSQFHSLRLARRETTAPAEGLGPVKSDARQLDYDFNYLIGRHVGLALGNALIEDRTSRYTSLDDAARASATLISGSGLSTRVTTTYIIQRFSKTNILELADTEYNIADLEVGYEPRSKRFKATVLGTNILDRNFSAFLQGLTLQQPRTSRRVGGTLQIRF
jgi:hypothetical protein